MVARAGHDIRPARELTDPQAAWYRSRYPDHASRFEAQVQLRRYLSPASVGREVDLVVLNDASPVFVAIKVLPEALVNWFADLEARLAANGA